MSHNEHDAPERELDSPRRREEPAFARPRSEPEEAEGARRDDFFVVGIGASAGGLEALEGFFTHMPADSGMAYVVVQHLSPDYKSLMAELLSRRTSMPVHRVADGTEIKPNNVYLIPPKKYMTIFHGRLFLTEQESTQSLRLPINVFFRSLAEDRGGRAIAIVLSGTGSDGTLGIRDIKGAGGMVMVQDEESARFDGMPRSALVTGLVDYALPPEEMPRVLLNFVKNPLLSEPKPELARDHDDVLTKVIALLRSQTGTDFSHYKRNTIVRRIQRRIGINQIDKLEHYLRYLRDSPAEVSALHKDLLIGVTNFFRDPQTFETLGKRVLSRIIESKDEYAPIRVWVAGCSTGEEAYSIAMIVQEQLEKAGRNNEVKIFATDIDREAILTAGDGLYPDSLTADVSMERLRRFFTRKGDRYQLIESIRKMIIFSPHDITRDPPFSKMDLVCCRNLLIYLNPEAQKRVLALLQFALNEEGYLLLGPSETIGDMSDIFETVDARHKIFQSKGRHRGPLLHQLGVMEGRHQGVRQRNAQTRRTQDAESEALESVFKTILSDYYPPFVTVDTDKNVVHLFGDLSPFLTLPQGKLNYNLRDMLRDDLAVAVTTAMQKAVKDKKRIVYEDVRLAEEESLSSINLVVQPVLTRGSEVRLVFIGFESRADHVQPEEADAEKFDIEAKAFQRIADLEQDLKHTRENLQATIEELETSNEELQATNEELLAANEELQSTNEELQSVNEELYTVNSEYQQKIGELTELNNDMDNLLRSTEIGTIFLDKDLNVRKFTAAAAREVNLLESDIGRPLSHISHDFDGDPLLEDAREVLVTLRSKERTVQARSGRTMLIRALPYRTENDTVKGVVITLIDMSERQQIAELIRTGSSFVEKAMRVYPALTYIYDLDERRITMSSPSIREVLGFGEGELAEDANIFDRLLHTEDQSRVAEHHRRLFRADDETIYEVEYRLKDASGSWHRFRSREMSYERSKDGVVRQVIGTATDISAVRRTTEDMGGE